MTISLPAQVEANSAKIKFSKRRQVLTLECQVVRTNKCPSPNVTLAHDHLPTEIQTQIQEDANGLGKAEAIEAPDRKNSDFEADHFPFSSLRCGAIADKQHCGPAPVSGLKAAVMNKKWTPAAGRVGIGSSSEEMVLQEIPLAEAGQLPSLACNYVSESEEPVRPELLAYDAYELERCSFCRTVHCA
jgi:hypothetical protein